MEKTSRFRRIAGVSILALALLWAMTALWLVPWLIAKAWAGEAGAFLNSKITGRAEVPLESYLAIWRQLAIRLTAALLAGLALALGVLAKRERTASALRRPAQGLPAAGGIGVLVFAVWAGVWFGVAEAAAYMVRSVVLNVPLGGVPWTNAVWMAPLAATATLSLLALAAVALERLLRARGANAGAMPTVLTGIGAYSLVRSMGLGLAPLAVGVLALVLGVAAARLMAGRPRVTRSIVRRTLPAGVAAIVAILIVVPLQHRLSEKKNLARLPAARPGAPSVLLVVWDAVRARTLSVYGYERRTTPVLEELAARGATFEQAIATAPWSLPSHASLFTGRYPFELSTGWTDPLDDTYPTLAEVLSRTGYATSGFVGNLYYGKRGFGLERGFAWYDDVSPNSLPVIVRTWWLSSKILGFAYAQLGDRREVTRRSASAVNRSFLDWQARNGERPFFAFLNYIDTHEPYGPPDPFDRSFGENPPQYWFERSGTNCSPGVLRQLEEACDGGPGEP